MIFRRSATGNSRAIKDLRTNLSTKLIERVIQMSSREFDLVLDPFGGSGTTDDVCERLNRQWIGIELENCDVIMERLQNGDLSPHRSDDYVED